MSVARWLETDSLTNQNIATALAIGAYTADADRMIVCDITLTEVAGNGDYVAYMTRQIAGAGAHAVVGPKTTLPAASGETALSFQSGMISVRSGDVLTCYVDGLAADTATPDTVVRWFEVATLRPATADRQLAVAATGEASANVTYWAGVAAGAAPATQTSVDDLPTNSELATALGTADDATLAAIAALNNLSSAQAQSAAAAALTAYDPPTNAEMEARTLPTASYFDPAADVVAHVTLVDTTTTNTDMVAAAPTAADIKTTMEADGGKLDHLWEMTADDAGVRQLTAHALELAPAGGAGSSDLDEILSEHDTEDTLGNVFNDLVEEAAGLYRLTTAALAMAPGGGGTLYSYSDTVDDGSNPLDGVFVQCATDAGFTNIIASTYSNASGAYTVRSDTAGTHYLRFQFAGWNFSDETVTLA